jgi:lipopolysaccharide/colanic/teichoic acid biosynthesis glycosyltransferase
MMMLKRSFDFIVSLIALVLLSPIFILISLLVTVTSRGGIFYIQKRVGKNFREFGILKFRTMKPDSDKKGLLTVGGRDPRVTVVGYYLRKYKLDELPQLINVLIGDMSFVGPRPEVKKYVDLYNEEQKKVLSVKPGITDKASIAYSNENEVLAKYPDAEKAYIEIVMPAKLKLNLEYIEHRSFIGDLKLMAQTVFKIAR